MSRQQVTHWAPYEAGAAILSRRIVKMGTSDLTVIHSDGPADAPVGVAQREGVASGETIGIATEGIAEVEYGSLVARGRLLTADSVGRATMMSPEATFMAIVAGAAANTNIAVSGIKASDYLINVLATDRTDVGNITVTDGNIQCSNSTASKNLIVGWRRLHHYIGLAQVDGGPGDIGAVIVSPGAL